MRTYFRLGGHKCFNSLTYGLFYCKCFFDYLSENSRKFFIHIFCHYILLSVPIRDTIFFIFSLCKNTNILRHTHKTASVPKFRSNFRLDSELFGKLVRLFSVVLGEIIQGFGIVTQLVIILDAQIVYRFKAQIQGGFTENLMLIRFYQLYCYQSGYIVN